MKTKKHKIEVEIPVGRYCDDGCEFFMRVYGDMGADYYCGRFGEELDCVACRYGGGVNDFSLAYVRCQQCLDKFGLEEEQ